MVISIYALIDPRDETVHYIGQSLDPTKRYRQHLSLQDNNLRKRAWISDLLEHGLKPVLSIIETSLSKDQAFEREAYWTRYYARKHQSPLTNAPNANTGYHCQEERILCEQVIWVNGKQSTAYVLLRKTRT